MLCKFPTINIVLLFSHPDVTRGFLYLGSGLCYDPQPEISTEVNMMACIDKAYEENHPTCGWDSSTKECHLTQVCDRDHLVGSSSTATTSTYIGIGQSICFQSR